MATLTLYLDLPPSHDPFVATWDIVNADLEVVKQGSLIGESADRAELAPGKYWARMQLPNGQTESRAFTLADTTEPQEVHFRYQPPALNDWYASASVAESPNTGAPQLRTMPIDVHVQAWAYEGQSWSMTTDAVGASLQKAEGVYQLDLAVDAPRLIALQVGGTTIASRFVILPPQGLSRVLLAPAAAGESSVTGSIELSVSLANSVADHLATFLTLASPSGRDSLDEKLARADSMDLLAEKFKDPLGAAVGGYFLVQQRSQTLPFDWLRRLSDRVPWLADGPILYAYAMLTFRQRDAADEAQHYLREAALRAYPVFRRGIELYLDACRMLESSKVTLPPEIESGSQRFAHVRAADTRQSAFTTFFGVHPNEPSAQRVVSSPAVSPHAALHELFPNIETVALATDVESTADLFTGLGSRLL